MTIMIEVLSPFNLGALIALYEHNVFVQAVIWETNPFYHLGVELGKKISKSTLEDIELGCTEYEAKFQFDDFTNRLLKHLWRERTSI